MQRFIVLIGMALMTGGLVASGAEREQAELSGPGWRVWLDEKAKFKADSLHLPEDVNLKTLPLNPPTGGWATLAEGLGKPCAVPACVEEVFSGGTNSWRYHGVSWFWRTFDVPQAWQGQQVYLEVEKARLRVEVYVNDQLAGYDLVAETPFRFDVTPWIKFGQQNRLAFRLTNPGGNRGFEDFGNVVWGKYAFPASHDFAGIGGRVTLVAKAPVHIDDVFVRNELPAGARNINVIVSINNTSPATVRRTVYVAVGEGKKNPIAVKEVVDAEFPPGETTVKVPLAAPAAKLWDMEHPNLYTCSVSLFENQHQITDSYSQSFGFRVFEVKAPAGDPNFYLNGKRLRLRSAIDWGYYALTGFYPTDEMASKSVEAARDIGHNSINFHRRIGEPLVFKHADERGLYLYEEPGGFHLFQGGNNVPDGSFAAKVMIEKCRRMFIRDRNHPSLLIYNLCNEDKGWNETRKAAMLLARDLDGTRFVSNTSGSKRRPINHVRPYETVIRTDFRDDHTVQSHSRFSEKDLLSHQEQFPSNLVYWGEVRCYTGPANWVDVAGDQTARPDGRPGYDVNLYAPMAGKIAAYYRDCRLSKIGSRAIQSPSAVSRQAGRGLMYIDGRLGQAIMSNDGADGYAINGWSAGPQLPDAWDSAICDEGRNLKGPASDFAYWTRPLQLVITRRGGKAFKPGDKADFNLALINENRLPAGDYTLVLSVKDGAGSECGTVAERSIKVAGGDVYAQKLEPLNLLLNPGWHGGHITVKGSLQKDGKTVAEGAEQVLLMNRSSYQSDLKGIPCAVMGWPAAKQALADAGVTAPEYAVGTKAKCILAGPAPADQALVDDMLKAVRKRGTTLIIRMDEAWAARLHEKGLLSEPVTQWGGEQTGHWNGNGWGYLDHFVGNQSIPCGTTIGTTSWEVPGDPRGFGPFVSDLPRGAYGAYLARKEGPANPTKPDQKRRVPLVTDDTLLVLIGTLDYGKGKLVLQAAYPVDGENAFCDMLFYNLISMGVHHNW